MLPKHTKDLLGIFHRCGSHGFFQGRIKPCCALAQKSMEDLFARIGIVFPHQSLPHSEDALLNTILFREHLSSIRLPINDLQDVHCAVSNVAEHITACECLHTLYNRRISLRKHTGSYKADAVMFIPEIKFCTAVPQ